MDNPPRDLDALTLTAGLAGFVLLVAVVASAGAMFKPGDWYEALAKPPWTPPNWVFPVAWTLLYLMIAIAGWQIWREAGFGGARLAFLRYFLQLALNAAWTPTFFGAHRILPALVIIVALWLAILATALAFRRVSSAAALLLFSVPVPLWTVADGVVWLPQQAQVRAGSAGEVVRILAEPGSQVGAGQPLLEIRDALLASEIRVLEARVREAKARLESQGPRDRVAPEGRRSPSRLCRPAQQPASGRTPPSGRRAFRANPFWPPARH